MNIAQSHVAFHDVTFFGRKIILAFMTDNE
jgi:hypothetical protein